MGVQDGRLGHSAVRIYLTERQVKEQASFSVIKSYNVIKKSSFEILS